jgi:hypothetical protein
MAPIFLVALIPIADCSAFGVWRGAALELDYATLAIFA